MWFFLMIMSIKESPNVGHILEAEFELLAGTLWLLDQEVDGCQAYESY